MQNQHTNIPDFFLGAREVIMLMQTLALLLVVARVALQLLVHAQSRAVPQLLQPPRQAAQGFRHNLAVRGEYLLLAVQNYR